MKNLAIVLLTNIVVGSSLFAESDEPIVTDHERLMLTDAFMGFSWSTLPNKTDQDRVAMVARVAPEKIMTGLEFGFSRKSGDLLSVKPMLEAKDGRQEIQSVGLWAFGSFQEGRITLDALWEIVRALGEGQIGDDQVLGMIAAGLSTHKEKWIPIQGEGPVKKAARTLKLQQFVKSDKIDLVGARNALHDRATE